VGRRRRDNQVPVKEAKVRRAQEEDHHRRRGRQVRAIVVGIAVWLKGQNARSPPKESNYRPSSSCTRWGRRTASEERAAGRRRRTTTEEGAARCAQLLLGSQFGLTGQNARSPPKESNYRPSSSCTRWGGRTASEERSAGQGAACEEGATAEVIAAQEDRPAKQVKCGVLRFKCNAPQ
jgi:hypothetical protein